ncbi:MAG: hypothetical protein KGR69_13075, partial [Verrucomicrobia bacterium]|nr:hypothetical protein [Verrucomicrobiota bacterium]
MPNFERIETARGRARGTLEAVKASPVAQERPLALYKEFLKAGRAEIREAHEQGGGGIDIAARRSGLMDVLLEDLFRHFLEETGAAKLTGQTHPVTIIASGGYGRAQLNPG